MAEGLRIRHTDPQVRGCVLIVPVRFGDKDTEIPIQVDGTGHAFVCKDIWDDLELARSQGWEHGFEISHLVKKPPNVIIGLGADPVFRPTKQLIERAMRDVAPRGTTVTITR